MKRMDREAQNSTQKITEKRIISQPWKQITAPATPGLNIKAKPEVKKMLAPVAAILKDSGAGVLNLVEHCGADIAPLEKAGVPAFSPIQDSRFYFNYHHSAADTLDKIVPKELAENSAVVAVVAYALANADQALPR